MLIHTFQHIRGITAKRELAFWQSGIVTWKDYEKNLHRQFSLFDEDILSMPDSPLFLSRLALEKQDIDFFANNLPNNEHYRIAATFPEKTMFLDIETTGLSKHYDKITLVGWSMGKVFGAYIQGGSDVAFKKAVAQAKILITFNGSLFDLPFIKQEFGELNLPICHVDLRFLSKRVGLSGGQKAIEAEIGVVRPNNLQNIAGEAAPVLWYKYRWGDMKALKQLIQYNHADIEGMKVIFDTVVDRMLDKFKAPQQIKKSLPHFSKQKSKVVWASDINNEGICLQPYKGVAGPLILLKDLHVLKKDREFKVVGIDLTGSENRPSGWCLLTNNVAETQCLSTDLDLIETTLSCCPDVVSIDSPLSIPKGRLSVSDADPGRDEFGIMRICERILKRRGVNVYPSLIPSMQKLTARGMRLAAHFRSLGVPVIESYPGAAQDIMGIPRKRASLEYLERGLHLFGIDGNFDYKKVTHDELDAITSAIVGLFFWSGKFEALGTEDEEYLIIPDLAVNTSGWRNRKVIGLSGPIATGKTTAGSFLGASGFVYTRFSLMLKKLLRDRGIEPTRDTLQEIGDEVFNTPGQRWLCKQIVRELPIKGNLVIDGLRHPEDHAFMVETFGQAFIHVHIESPEEERIKRYLADGNSKEEYEAANAHHVEMEINKLTSLAHVVIHNGNDIGSLIKQIAKIAKIDSKLK